MRKLGTSWLGTALVSVLLVAAGCAYDQVLVQAPGRGQPPPELPLLPPPVSPAPLPHEPLDPPVAVTGRAEASTGPSQADELPAPAALPDLKQLEMVASPPLPAAQQTGPPTASWSDEPEGLSPVRATSTATAAEPLTGPPPGKDSATPAGPARPGPGPEALPRPRKADEAEPLAMHLDDLDVRKALEILSRAGSLNIVISPNVSGRVTANLHGLSPDEALDAILRLSHLVAQHDHGIVYVYSAEELSKADDRERRLPVRVYRLNYLRSTDLAAMVKPLLSTQGKLTTTPASQGGLGSGTQTVGVSPVPESSSGNGAATGGGGSAGTAPGSVQGGGDALAGGDIVIVQDHEAVLRTVDQIVTQVDVAPVQVLIEAVIMSVTLDKSHELGVNFGVLDLAGHTLTVAGNGALLNTSVGFAPAAGLLTAGGGVNGTSSAGFAADEHGLKFGFVDHNVTGFIRALDTVGRTDILACPRLLVLNKQRAELQLGDRLGYQTLAQNGTSTIQQVQFLDVGTLLRVRPFISSDGLVRMEIHPERSTGQVVNGIPQTSTSEVTTNVMVPDGATIVIGGLMENEDDNTLSGVPGLYKLPVLGALFRQTKRISTKKELIVLLTPHIWQPRPGAPPSLPVAPPVVVPAGATAPLPVPPPATRPVTIAIQGPVAPLQTGQEAVYDIQVTNAGRRPVEGMAVGVTLTPGLRAAGAEGPVACRMEERRLTYQLLSELAPQATTTYRVRARAVSPGSERLRVQVWGPRLPAGLQAERETSILPGRPVALGQPNAVGAVEVAAPH